MNKNLLKAMDLRPSLITVELLISRCFVYSLSISFGASAQERERDSSFDPSAVETFTSYWISVDTAFLVSPCSPHACSTSRNSSSIKFPASRFIPLCCFLLKLLCFCYHPFLFLVLYNLAQIFAQFRSRLTTKMLLNCAPIDLGRFLFTNTEFFMNNKSQVIYNSKR